MASRLDAARARLSYVKAARTADAARAAAPVTTAPASTAAPAEIPPLAPPPTAEEVEKRQEQLVVTWLEDGANGRAMWAIGYSVIHFIVGTSCLYLLWTRLSDEHSDDVALLLPFRGAVEESTLLAALAAIAAAMACSAYAVLARRAVFLHTAMAVSAWPCLLLLLAAAKTPALQWLWYAWMLALGPPLVLVVQLVSERQFAEAEQSILNSYTKIRLERVEEAAKAKAMAAALSDAMAHKKGRR